MRLLLATRNAHKVREIQAALAGSDLSVVGLDDLPGLPDELPETGETFEDNALQKARFVFDATGEATLADDSGIEVRALGQAPGVHSKRWSPEGTDEANNALLLASLAGETDRRARYRCALAFVLPQPGGADEISGVATGTCNGRIGFEPRGSGGFGYDPYFWPDEAPGRAMAELTLAEKNAISHRGRALVALRRRFEALGLIPPSL